MITTHDKRLNRINNPKKLLVIGNAHGVHVACANEVRIMGSYLNAG
jgi:hypothetical protein